LVILALAGCTAVTPAPGTSPPAVAAVSPSSAPGGCGTTSILFGGQPDWTASAGAPAGPYVLSHEGNLVGVLFGYPLRAGEPTNPANKILWIAREPRGGHDLQLTLRPLAGTAEPVTQSEPANSGPGEIYPSIVNVPAAGCYTVQAAWSGNVATLELPYQ